MLSKYFALCKIITLIIISKLLLKLCLHTEGTHVLTKDFKLKYKHQEELLLKEILIYQEDMNCRGKNFFT